MRFWQLAAGGLVMMTTHMAPASAEALVPAGLDGGGTAGHVPASAVQSGSQSGEFRLLRVRLVGSSAEKKPRLRRIGSMMDFYPDQDLGLHVSAGIRTLFKKSRGAFSPFQAAKTTSLIYTPAIVNVLPVHSNIKRTSPALAMGWTRAVDSHTMIGFEAGTTFDHGGGRSIAMTGSQRWSRIDPVAQASFALRF